MARLDGKVVIVTGAAQGIGSAYARALLAEGACVIANDIDGERLGGLVSAVSAEHAGRIAPHVADITGWDAAGGLINRAVEQFGRIDALVNNAGLYDVRRAEENDPASISPLVQVNLLGTMYCGIHAMRAMLAAEGGSIINVTSGALVGLPLRGIYSATKAAVAALTWSWAQDLRDTAVRVNALSPLARTRQLDVAAGYLKVPHEQLMSDVPPEANAPVLVYLLSDEARDVRGQIVRISDRTLTLITRPEVVQPGVTLADRSVETVGRAFAEHLRRHMREVSAPDWSPVGGQKALSSGSPAASAS